MRADKGIEKIIVVGGVAAGMSAASKARRNLPNCEIKVFEQSEHVSYGACGLPYYISDVIHSPDKLVVMSAGQFKEKRNLDVFIRHRAESFDARKKTVTVRDLDSDRVFTEDYDKLIIATGAGAIMPPFARQKMDGVFALRSMEDGMRIRYYVEQQQPKRVVIIGSGYIGLEMAENLKLKDMDVVIVEKLPQVLPNIDADMAALVQQELEANGCRVKTDSEVESIEGDNKVTAVRLASGQKIVCDLVIVSIGVRPNTAFAASGGVSLGRTGAIAVNQKMETNLKDVYAAGDCAEGFHTVLGKAVFIPLGTTANKQGRIAGDNASGKFARFHGIVGTAVVKVFEQEIARTGLSLFQAEQAGFACTSVSISGHSRAGYYPGGKQIQVKLVFERENGRLLGGQLVGGEGVSKRIDVLATALQQRMTVEELAQLDLSYAPPFAPVWDPILVAANVAAK